MFILPINEKPNIRNLSHNAYCDSILSSKMYTGGTIAVFTVTNEYQSIMRNCVLQMDSSNISIIQNNRFQDTKILMYKKISDGFSEKVCIIYQKQHYAWSGFNFLFTNCVDMDYDIEEKSVVKIGHPAQEKTFLKINRHIQKKFNKIPQGEYPIEFYFAYRNGNIDVCIKSKGEMEKFKMQLPASIRKGDLFFQISIEPGENQYYNWLYNNNIQLIAYEDQYKNLLVDYYNKPRKNYRPYISDYMFEMSSYENYHLKKRKNLIKDIEGIIKKKIYIVMKIDQFYIDGCDEYQKEHHIHEMLVYGFDDKKKDLYMLGYLKAGLIGKVKLKYSKFRDAFREGDEDNFSLIRYLSHEKMYRLQINTIKCMLIEYINPKKNRGGEIAWLPSENGIFGIKIYDAILERTELLNQFICDVRMSYTMYEHKRIMKERFEYLLQKKVLNESKIIGKIDNILSKLAELKNAAAYYKMTGIRKVNAQYVTECLECVKKEEIELYYNVIKELERNEKNM